MSNAPKVRVRPAAAATPSSAPASKASKVIKSLPRAGPPRVETAAPKSDAKQSGIVDFALSNPLIIGVGVGVLVLAGIGVVAWMSRRDEKRALAMDGNESYITRLRLVEEKLLEQQAAHHAENFPKQPMGNDESLAEAAPIEAPPVPGHHNRDPNAPGKASFQTGAVNESYQSGVHDSRIPAYRITPFDPYAMT